VALPTIQRDLHANVSDLQWIADPYPLVPASLSIVRQVFTDPIERARAIGIWSAVFGLGVAAGPIVGGALVSGVGWRAVFWINIPIGLATWLAAQRSVPESRAAHVRAVDPVGQLPVIAVLGALTYSLIQGPAVGWGSPLIVGLFCNAPFSAATAIAAGGALLLDLQPHASLVQPVVSYALLGCGFGLINPPITHTAVSGMPPERAEAVRR